MVRVIYASHSKNKANGNLVNRIGQYLNKHIDGAYKMAFHPNECEIFTRMYYQVPGNPETLDEMKFIISVTTYANKIRVNLIEDNEYEKTVGQLILSPEDLMELEDVRKRVLTMIKKSLDKEFAKFDFVY